MAFLEICERLFGLFRENACIYREWQKRLFGICVCKKKRRFLAGCFFLCCSKIIRRNGTQRSEFLLTPKKEVGLLALCFFCGAMLQSVLKGATCTGGEAYEEQQALVVKRMRNNKH